MFRADPPPLPSSLTRMLTSANTLRDTPRVCFTNLMASLNPVTLITKANHTQGKGTPSSDKNILNSAGVEVTRV